jgi:hypothetical protein
MSEENVEIVGRAYEEVSAHVWEASPDLFDPEYEVDLLKLDAEILEHLEVLAQRRLAHAPNDPDVRVGIRPRSVAPRSGNRYGDPGAPM